MRPIRLPTALFIRRLVWRSRVQCADRAAGLAAYFGIEVRELPDVDRPVITVNTAFNGASPETVWTSG